MVASSDTFFIRLADGVTEIPEGRRIRPKPLRDTVELMKLTGL